MYGSNTTKGTQATSNSYLYTYLTKVRRNNQLRDTFYETLENVLEKIPRRDVIVIAGDFNAKTGSGHKEFSEHRKIWKRNHKELRKDSTRDL